MKKMILVLMVLLLSKALYAGSSANHSVTVTVTALNEIEIVGGNITLTLNAASDPGADPDDVSDNSTCDLEWTVNETDKKITVATDLASPNYTLTVVAENISGGTAESAVTLSDTAQDFVTAISETLGSCDLSYTGSADASEGDGSDAHTVTYTITSSS